jgi:hypothetical protein
MRNTNKRIEAIQNVTHRSVEAIQGISFTIRELDRFSVRIASAARMLSSVSVSVTNQAKSEQVRAFTQDIR